MKTKYCLLILLFITFCSLKRAPVAKKTSAKAPITTGSLVILRTGDGFSVLSSAATPVFLDEYTTTGTLIQSIAIPTTVSGANFALTCAGSSTSEGQVSRSADGRYVFFTGYNAAAGTAAVATSTAIAVNRVVGRLDVTTGGINSATGLPDFAGGGNPRCATSSNGTDIWVCGSNSGIRYTTIGATSSTQLSATPTNLRTVNIFNNQLYISAATATFQGISTVGTGMPSTAGQTIAPLPGFPITSGPSSYNFSIKPAAGNIAYVADDRAIALGGGIQKWTFSAGNWTLAYTLTNGLSAGMRGLDADWSGGLPVLNGTTADALPRIIKITDAGASSVASTLAVSPVNTAFRSIAFILPFTILPVHFENLAAYPDAKGVKINWSNLTESNILNYQVERSVNGINFISISTIGPLKNNSDQADYSTRDSLPLTGNNFYRIRSTETDGKKIYSSTVKVFLKDKIDALEIYPNPVTQKHFSIRAGKMVRGRYSITLVNGLGQQLYHSNLEHTGGAFNKIIFLPGNFHAGNCHLVITGGNLTVSKEMLIK